MIFDGAEAALAVLQNHTFIEQSPYPAEAEQAGPMLDAAMLAEADVAAPAELEGAALMVVPEEDAGDLLIASLMEMIDAPPEAMAPAQASTNLEANDSELASMNVILPGDEEFFGETLSNTYSGTTVKTGQNVGHYFVSAAPPEAPPVEGDTAVLEPADGSETNPDAGYHVYVLFELGLKLKMPEDEWNALNQAQKDALFHVLENYKKSPDLEAALKHLKNEGVEVVIRFGERSWHAVTGKSFAFADDTIAGMSTDDSDDARTNLRAGSLAIISFNSKHSGSATFNEFGSTLVHELLHPWVPNTEQWIGGKQVWSDHDRVYDMEAKAWALITAP
jgi:hypothetical protein